MFRAIISLILWPLWFAYLLGIFPIFLVYTIVVNKKYFEKNRGWILVLAFTFGMLLSPPDVISQIMLAVPVYLLFELGLLFSNEKEKS